MLGASVSVVDALNPMTVLTSGSTDAATGAFSLEVLDDTNFTGAFIKVIVTGDTDAEMVCDSTYNCGGAQYGDSFAIDDMISLSAIIPTPGPGTTAVNLNMLTEMAAQLTEAATGGVTATNLSDSNLRVATLFDFAGAEFHTIASFTDPMTNDLNAAMLGLLSGGLLGSCFDAADPVLALNDFFADFVSNSGELTVSDTDPEKISMTDIYDRALIIDPAVVDINAADYMDRQNNQTVIDAQDSLGMRSDIIDLVVVDNMTVDGEIPAPEQDGGGLVFHTDANGDRLVVVPFSDFDQAVPNNCSQNWDNATAAAAALDLGGFQDWRLPSMDELNLLLDAINIPLEDNFEIWSSTEVTINGSNIYANSTSKGSRLVNISPKFIPLCFLPIRDFPMQ